MEPRPSGTVTFLFTDIEGSSRLWDEYPQAMGQALSRHDTILRDAVEGHAGVVFAAAGDGVAAAFQRSGDALAAALEAQRRLAAQRWPAGAEILVRMGLNTGEAEERDGGYFGAPLNRAARLMAAGVGGQVLVSGSTASVLPEVPDVELLDLGSHRFRGLSEPMRAFGVRAEGLRWSDRPLASLTAGNLPIPPTRWVGERDELRKRAGELVGRRLLTLTGPGGVGKSRLAVEMGAVAAPAFVDGAWLVELAPVDEAEAVVSVVASSTLSIRVQEEMSLAESVIDWLRDRRLLLILDNCEHLVRAVAELVKQITRSCPLVTVVATSREPLGIDGERVYPVPSLAIDNAVELFRDRATANDETTVLSDADLSAIAAICERLDGIPLAVELAAARMRSLSPEELLGRLHDRFRLLRGSGRGGLERHQTLRATVGWSYELLSEEERRLFERVSVFAGGFDLAAIEAVCAGEDVDSSELFDLLSSLLDKSMVAVEHGEQGTRYRMLETLRQFAEERLVEAHGTEALRDRHLDYYVHIARRTSGLLQSPDEREAVRTFTLEWPNLRAAHTWALASSDLERAADLLGSLTVYAGLWGQPELAEWAERTLVVGDGSASIPALSGIAAHWAYVSGDTDRALALARRGIRDAKGEHDPAATFCWYMLATTGDSGLAPDAVLDAARRCEAGARAAEMPAMIVLAIARQAQVVMLIDPAALPELLTHLEEEAARVGSPMTAVTALLTRARIALVSGDPEMALGRFRDVRELAARHGLEDYEATAAVGVAVAQSLLGADADASFAEAVVLTAAERNWGHQWRAVRSVANHFVRTGRREEATAVHRHLAHYGRRDIFPGDPGVDSFESEAATTEGVAHGPAMRRDEFVEHLLGLLGAAGTPSSRDLG